MVSEVVAKYGRESMKKNEDIADFSVGDSVNVHTIIREGDKERVQVYKGIVIARDGRGATETFTVRRVSHGVGVEKIFPVRSPHIAKIEVESRGRARRAKLYYLRGMTGKETRQKTTVR